MMILFNEVKEVLQQDIQPQVGSYSCHSRFLVDNFISRITPCILDSIKNVKILLTLTLLIKLECFQIGIHLTEMVIELLFSKFSLCKEILEKSLSCDSVLFFNRFPFFWIVCWVLRWVRCAQCRWFRCWCYHFFNKLNLNLINF